MSRNALVLWTAQGFGLGRIPVAPGTFGTVLGVPWTLLLLWTGSAWGFALGALAAIAGAVWVCGEAEELLGRKDPGAIVLDEIVALPLAHWGWMTVHLQNAGTWPGPGQLLTDAGGAVVLGIFLAFRAFDILKPWPVGLSQRLWGGLGVVADDVLAALWVTILWLGVARFLAG